MSTQNESSAQVATEGVAPIAAPAVQNQTTVSQNQAGGDKYSKYFKMNGLDEGGNPLEDSQTDTGSATGSKAGTEAQPAPEKKQEGTTQQPNKPRSGYERRIDVLTARDGKSKAEIRRLRAEIEALKQSAGEGGKKVSRENYVSDDEFQEDLRKETARAIKNEILLETKNSQLEQVENQVFKESWGDKVNAYYPDQESRVAYSTLLKQAKAAGINPHQDVHDYVQDSSIGPVLLEYLLRDPNALATINDAKPVVRATRLYQLEQGLMAYLQEQANGQQAAAPSRQQPAQAPARRVTQAPAPIGPVGNGGAAVADSGDSTSAVINYKRQRYGK